jgi:lipopolysaccharide biosynthesis regulator YciM
VGGVAKSAAYEAAPEASTAHKRARDDDHAAATCKRKVDDIEGRTRADKDYAPTPEEELAIGKCYQALRNVAEARKWLQRAAAHRKTKARAEKALRELAPE